MAVAKQVLGGVTVTAADIQGAVDILKGAKGVKVKEPLAQAGHPLGGAAEGWYHAFAQEEIAAYPDIAVKPGTHSEPSGHVKEAVLHRLERLAGPAGPRNLADLVTRFRGEADYPDHGRDERFAERGELALGLTLEGLAEPDARLLRRLAGPAFGSPGPQPGFNRLLQTDDGLARVASSLRYLLFDEALIEDRLDSCIRGERKLPGVGEAMMVKALAVADPSRWVPCYVTAGKSASWRSLPCLARSRRPG